MGFLTLLIVLLTFSHWSNSESPEETDESSALNWIEKILLFPCCVIDTDIKTPLDDMEEAMAPTETSEDKSNTIEVPDHPEVADHLEQDDGAMKRLLQTVYETEQDGGVMKRLLQTIYATIIYGKDAGGVIKRLLQTLYKTIIHGKDAICETSDTAWQQLGIIGAKIREIIMILGAKTWKIIKILVEENKLLLENMATVTWFIRDLMVDNVSEAQWLLKNMTTATWYVRDLLLHYVGEAVRVVIEVFTYTPCEMELGEHTIMDNMKSTVGILVGDINWYMFSTLVALAGTLAVQLFRRKGASRKKQEEKKYINLSANLRLRSDQTRKTTKISSDSPNKDQLHGCATSKVSPDSTVTQTETQKHAKTDSPIKRDTHKTTKSHLETYNNHRLSPLEQKTPSPQSRVVDRGLANILAKTDTKSDVHVATDTDDLEPPTDKHSSKSTGTLSLSSPVWIRYGSSPTRRGTEAIDFRRPSPLWVRRISSDEDGVTSYIQREAKEWPSPVKQKYIPSPIYNQSLEADIGDPCCSSSFIEECLSESDDRMRRDSGDSLLHSRTFRPSVITKRYTKRKEEDFNISQVSSTDSMLLDVSDVNKSIALYNGDGMVFYELVFFYAFKNIFHRIRELVTWSRDARIRRNFR